MKAKELAAKYAEGLYNELTRLQTHEEIVDELYRDAKAVSNSRGGTKDTIITSAFLEMLDKCEAFAKEINKIWKTTHPEKIQEIKIDWMTSNPYAKSIREKRNKVEVWTRIKSDMSASNSLYNDSALMKRAIKSGLV